MGAILGAILNFRVTISLYMSFDCFRWLTSVENIYLDAIIFTPSAFLSGIGPFQCSPLDSDDGHFGGHLEFEDPIEI